MGYPPIELRAYYTYTPAIKGDLETEPVDEEYEVTGIRPIFVGGESTDRKILAASYARRAMIMYENGGDEQFHSVLRNLK